jgi:hypothetical protein
MSSVALGRVFAAQAGFRGAVDTLDRTLALEDGETVLEHGAVRLRRRGTLPRPAVLRLTTQRLIVLAHHAVAPDRIWELPPGAVTGLRRDWSTLVVQWRDAAGDGHDLPITAWTGRPALDRPIRDVDELGHALETWRAAPP